MYFPKPLETINIKGHPVKIYRVINADNPCDIIDFSFTLVTMDSLYIGGNNLPQGYDIHSAIEQYLCEQGIRLNDIMFNNVYHQIRDGYRNLSVTPDSSNCSKHIGIIYKKVEDILQEFSTNEIELRLAVHLHQQTQRQIALINAWLRGETYAIDVCNNKLGTFYGANHKQSGLLETATAFVDGFIDENKRNNFSQYKHNLKQKLYANYRV